MYLSNSTIGTGIMREGKTKERSKALGGKFFMDDLRIIPKSEDAMP